MSKRDFFARLFGRSQGCCNLRIEAKPEDEEQKESKPACCNGCEAVTKQTGEVKTPK